MKYILTSASPYYDFEFEFDTALEEIDIFDYDNILEDTYSLIDDIMENISIDNHGYYVIDEICDTIERYVNDELRKLKNDFIALLRTVDASGECICETTINFTDSVLAVAENIFSSSEVYSKIGQIIEACIESYLEDSSWHYGLKSSSGILTNPMTFPNPIIHKSGEISWHNGSDELVPIMWFGSSDSPLTSAWTIDLSLRDDALSFWRESDSWSIMENICDANEAFLIWYCAECGYFVPDLEELLLSCPIRFPEEADESIIRKLLQEFLYLSYNHYVDDKDIISKPQCSSEQTLTCEIWCRSSEIAFFGEIDSDLLGEDFQFEEEDILNAIDGAVAGDPDDIYYGFIYDFMYPRDFQMPESGIVDTQEFGSQMYEDAKNEIRIKYGEADVYISIIDYTTGFVVKLIKFDMSIFADHIIDIIDYREGDDGFLADTASAFENILEDFVRNGSWHLGLKNDNSIITEFTNISYELSNDEMRWTCDGKVCTPILWYGPENDTPKKLWTINSATTADELKFWFTTYWDTMDILSDYDYAMLHWYINECANFDPDMAAIRSHCLIELNEKDSLADIIQKMNLALMRQIQ